MPGGYRRRGGRPPAVDEDLLAAARARQARGESITTIARRLGVGRSTLYRALHPQPGGGATAEPAS
jgi:DNA-binding phage protein